MGLFKLQVCVCADGQKIFQSEFIGIIHPGANLIGQLEYNLLNSSVALFGYYLAAFTIDRPWMGRKRMQVGLPCNHETMCLLHVMRPGQACERELIISFLCRLLALLWSLRYSWRAEPHSTR